MMKLRSPFILGFLGALAAVLIVGVIYSGILLWSRALHGEQAYEYIQHVIQAQQAAQQKVAPPGRP